MNKSYSYLIKNGNFNIEKYLPQINAISFIGLVYLIFRFIFVAFFQNSYEVLHIDERIIINDIYNVWNLDNEFNRYPNVENDLIKNIYLVITEFAYGGDLRYGRIWSNIFIVFLGPFSLFGDQTFFYQNHNKLADLSKILGHLILNHLQILLIIPHLFLVDESALVVLLLFR